MADVIIDGGQSSINVIIDGENEYRVIVDDGDQDIRVTVEISDPATIRNEVTNFLNESALDGGYV